MCVCIVTLQVHHLPLYRHIVNMIKKMNQNKEPIWWTSILETVTRAHSAYAHDKRRKKLKHLKRKYKFTWSYA